RAVSLLCAAGIRPVFFFFQAEDGIRDRTVTGVQTCALPIFDAADQAGLVAGRTQAGLDQVGARGLAAGPGDADEAEPARRVAVRSEERREGKSVGRGGGRVIEKKKQTKKWGGGLTHYGHVSQ